MIAIPTFLIIPLLIAAAGLSGWQHVRIPRPHPLAGVQIWLIVFCIVMILVVDLMQRGEPNPGLSVAFFVVAVAVFLFAIRQNRMVPPRERK